MSPARAAALARLRGATRVAVVLPARNEAATVVGVALAGTLGWVAFRHEAAEAVAVPASVAGAKSLVVLGDSVTTGTSCSCTPFPTLIGEYLTNQVGHQVDVDDDGVDGDDTAGLLKRLDGDAEIRQDVAGADIVLVTIGANDLGELADRGPGSDDPCAAACYEPAAKKAAGDVGTVVGKVHALAPKAKILVTDYWNVFTDGTRATDPPERAYTRSVTEAFNADLKPVVAASGATYVGLVTSFRGADGQGDPTQFLLADGDHPDAQGHERIAKAALTALGVSV